MQRDTLLPLAGSLGRGDLPALKVVIAYQDFETGRQAQRALDFLVASLTREWKIIRQMWKFELLRIPELREIAVADAAMANLIIVACHKGNELPEEVKVWLEAWRGRKGEVVALIALVDGAPEQAEHTRGPRASLEQAARRAQVEFIAWPKGLPKQENWGRTRTSETVEEPLLEAV